ncbi:MAG: phosphoribosylanthranilate isomerase [Pseudomonadota bacterium]
MVAVKVCCIQSLEEAERALAAGADALGLVGEMPSGPGPIPDSRIAEIAGAVAATTVLLTAETQADDIIAHAQRCPTTALQLVDGVAPRDIALLRAALPERQLIQAIHVNGPSAVDQARDVWDHVDQLLLDSGSPNKAVKELGGTGRTHDWRISAEIVREGPIPVWLAGGLTPENVTEAIRTTRPHGVDICSGIRRNMSLDANLMNLFFAAVARARSFV